MMMPPFGQWLTRFTVVIVRFFGNPLAHQSINFDKSNIQILSLMINPQLLFKLASPMPSPDRQTLDIRVVIISMIVIKWKPSFS